MLSLGLDPGWKNFGVSLVEFVEGDPRKVKIIEGECYCISGAPEEFVNRLCTDTRLSQVSIERYVSYANVRSGEAENITQVIGMIRMKYYLLNKERSIIIPNSKEGPVQVSLVRAIEWKTRLVQLLNKYCEFSNPSMDLDKKFSMAAAKRVVTNPEFIRNDHIADAVCVAALSVFERSLASTKPRIKL